MKLTTYQKIILILYSLLFIYFSIIHVPFKTIGRRENVVEYDTLFSNKSNIDVSRLVIIILIITILASVFLLLIRNLSFKIKPKINFTKKHKVFLYIVILIALVLTGIFFINRYQNTNAVTNTPIQLDSASSKPTIPANSPSQSDLKKAETCNENQALTDFKSYMKFYYSDWKIFGKPVIKESSGCRYEIQFTTMNPHIRYEKEVIIVEIAYSFDYEHYTFRTVRGILY